MSQPYVGEIRMFGGNFAPAGWMFCEGQLLPISEYETLFNLIGTTYGGDGQSTFALPDLRGRLPIHMGSGFVLSQNGGAETVTLTTRSNACPHPHGLRHNEFKYRFPPRRQFSGCGTRYLRSEQTRYQHYGRGDCIRSGEASRTTISSPTCA